MAFETLTNERYDSSTRVYITITDVNDNSPEFQQPSYNASITEHIPIGSFVIEVSMVASGSSFQNLPFWGIEGIGV